MRIINKFFLIFIFLLLNGCISSTNKHTHISKNELGEYNKTSNQPLNLNELEQFEVSYKADSNENNIYKAGSSDSTVTSNHFTATGESKNTGSGQQNIALPNNAKPGECYARVQIPAKYRTETKRVLIHDPTYAIENIPAQYAWGEERVLVKEASETITIIPAKYEWKTIPVLVKRASVQVKTIPAVYKDETTKVLVKEAYTKWKKGRGPMEKINNATGEIMCLIEVPAEYKTVTKKVVITPEKTEKIMIPAVYKNSKKSVLVRPEEKIKKKVPAEYKTIKVKKVVVPAQQRRVEVPAVYGKTVEKIKISDNYYDWRKILCETNTTSNVVYKLQNALQELGYNPGEPDGIIGKQTMKAVKRYQQEKKLAVGQITIETLKTLEIIH
ncbi:MAG: hypothetical protein GQ529_11355 [Methyloprofundus sp.]|nr:hypothetical protein [Methyloprofundus sp.]